MVSLIQNPMNGIFYGQAALASPISMKVLMNTKKLIITLNLMKLPARIDSAITWFACKNALVNKILTLYLIHISCQMNSVIFTPIIRN